MASRDARERVAPSALLPLDSEDGLVDAGATRLSWALGDRVLDAGDPDRAFDCEHAGSAARITAFDATEDTHLLRVRTPVGRERYYELPNETFAGCAADLADDSAWRVVADSRGRNA